MKNRHSKNEAFHTTSKTENFKKVIVIMKVLPWNEEKRRGRSVPRESCGYFSHPLDVYEASPEWSPFGPADIVVETQVKNCSKPLERKGLEVTFYQHDFKCNVQEHPLVHFYEVIIDCYPNLITSFYFPLALVTSNSNYC